MQKWLYLNNNLRYSWNCRFNMVRRGPARKVRLEYAADYIIIRDHIKLRVLRKNRFDTKFKLKCFYFDDVDKLLNCWVFAFGKWINFFCRIRTHFFLFHVKFYVSVKFLKLQQSMSKKQLRENKINREIKVMMVGEDVKFTSNSFGITQIWIPNCWFFVQCPPLNWIMDNRLSRLL
jgi:hypothetical protein